MITKRQQKFFEILIRVIVDIILVEACLLFVFLLNFLMELFQSGNIEIERQHFLIGFYQDSLNFLLLGLISVCVFSARGIYTRARRYPTKSKIFLIIQSITLSYLIFAACDYFFHLSQFFPRSSLVYAWMITAIVLAFSRAWAGIWRHMTVHAISDNSMPLRMSAKSVLVIGGAGYIGSALLPKLLNAGYSVRLLDIFMYGEEPIQDCLKHPKLEIIKADFRQIDQVVRAVKGVNAVIHLGGLVGDPACAVDEELTLEVNLMATRMIAEVCKGFGVQRFIFASTCSVYGASDEVLDESSALNPVSLYAKTKIACEKVLREMCDDTFVPINLRFSTIFGFSGRTRFDLVVNLLTAKAFFEKKITVMGGDQWRPFLHVDDAAASVLLALQAPIDKVKNEVFNVGNNHLNYTLMQLGELIHQQVPTAELFDLGMDGDKRNYRVNFDKITQQLGYQTQWTLESGITQVLDALKGGSVVNYKDVRYSNVLYLREKVTDVVYHWYGEKLLEI